MNKGSSLSYYLISPEHPIIQEWDAYFKKMDVQAAPWSIAIEHTAIIQQQVQPVHDMLCALQHYPQLIAGLVFSLEIKFKRARAGNADTCDEPTLAEDASSFYMENEWADALHIHWLAALGNFPAIIFFLQDADCRFFAMAGDMIISREAQYIPRNAQQQDSFILDIPQMKKLVIRVWNACRFFMLYCYYSDFDTRSYIEQMIREFHMPFSYADVKAQHEQDVMNGATPRLDKFHEN